ncbi:MAG: alpha,alpha-trehalose-phosphate synthase (UDP-forming) [Acidimicrobiales bacterium]
MASPRADLLVLSNRGPVSFVSPRPGAPLVARRGAGGLVVTLGAGAAAAGALWIASAATPEDRQAASGGIDVAGYHLRYLPIEPRAHQGYCDVVANGTLWPCLHGLWDLPRRPRLDRRWHEAWASYREVNARFADAAAELAAPGATVLIHDYHLALVPGLLAQSRPDLRSTAFLHTPWCSPGELAVLPDPVAAELLDGLAGAGACGFHAERWAVAFGACCEAVLGRRPATFVAPAAADRKDLVAAADSPACHSEGAALDAQVGDRRLIVRVDRVEPSKNVLRGFWAFDELLEGRPELRGRVCFAAMVYPSRQNLADYLAYAQEIQTLARRINQRWGDGSWTPVLLRSEDNHPLSVAALQRYDVLLVNPVRDGLNLVAHEGPLLNRRNGVLVLSRQAGCWDQLGSHALGVNPFDVSDTAAALGAAMDLPDEERRSRAVALRRVAGAHTPLDWWDQLVLAAGAPTG